MMSPDLRQFLVDQLEDMTWDVEEGKYRTTQEFINALHDLANQLNETE